MSHRDEFSALIKRALAERSGFRCSYLGCSNATTGPSEESETAVARTGVACHITAAAPGGKRYDSGLTPVERGSITNAIWMCQTHSVEIDRDEARYTTTLLKHWKNISESRADYAKNHGWDIFNKFTSLHIESLANINLILTNSSKSNDLIGNAITDSCLPQIWGKDQSIIIRDLIIEIYRNAFAHGEATSLEISISEKKLEIIYDGKEFDIFRLLSRQDANGGADTLREILEKYSSDFIVNYRYEDTNQVIIHSLSDFYELAPSLPCVISLSEYDNEDLEIDLSIHERCGALYIILPMHFCRSDVRGLESQLSAFEPNGKPVYIVGSNMTELTRKAIISRLPNFTLVHKQC